MPRNTARGTRLCLVSCCTASDEIDGPIVRDPKQPGFELPGVIELIEFSVSLELRLLRDIFAIHHRARHTSTVAVQDRSKLRYRLEECQVTLRRGRIESRPAVVELYDALWALTASPVVAINRVLAVAEIRGAAAALSELSKIAADVRLAEYQPYWAARAELLAKTGATDDARDAYETATGLERDAPVRRFLQRRQSALVS